VVSEPSPEKLSIFKLLPLTAALTEYTIIVRELAGAVPKVKVVPDTLYAA